MINFEINVRTCKLVLLTTKMGTFCKNQMHINYLTDENFKRVKNKNYKKIKQNMIIRNKANPLPENLDRNLQMNLHLNMHLHLSFMYGNYIFKTERRSKY